MIKTVFCQEDANDLEKLGFKLFSTNIKYGYIDELPQVGRVAKDKAFSVFVVQVES